MTKEKTNVLIIGAGRAGTALLKMFHEDDSIQVIGIVDIDENASGIKWAHQHKIPTAEHWSELIKAKGLDEVIDATGKNDVHAQVLKDAPQAVKVTSRLMARALWFLAKEYEEVERRIQEAKEDIEAHEWGMQKTNQAIKTLYAELEAKNKELRELDRLKSDFISTVSHELRTPLAITKEGISLIQDGVLGHINDKQAKVLVTAKDSIDRLSRLISSLLDISKIEAGHRDIDKRMINMNKAVEQIISLFDKQAGDKGIQLKSQLPGKPVDIYADYDKIIQVFTNLVSNAIKFTDQGYIQIGVEDQDGEIQCTVEDTGKGVAKEDISKMFVKFQQIDRVHGDGERGTGLGLSIAKAIIEMHGGEIWAESEVQKGTKIFFTIPKYDEKLMFREYVDRGLEEARKNDHKMSLMIVRVGHAGQEKESLSDDAVYDVLKGVEGVLNESVNSEGGATALKESRGCFVILDNSSKESVLSAEGRLKQAVDDYLTRQKLTDKILFYFGCATYPDDAQNGEDLIKQALKN